MYLLGVRPVVRRRRPAVLQRQALQDAAVLGGRGDRGAVCGGGTEGGTGRLTLPKKR